MHEIVTLQFGSQSNYVGTHFWNAQESYFTYSENVESPVDHDIHFRAGVGTDGSDTFTPRTLIYDIRENFGTLRQVNALYELQHEPDASGVWGGPPLLRQSPQISLHPYQSSLEAGVSPQPISSPSVRFWSDFNRVYYHPRSLVQLTLPSSHLVSGSSTQLTPLDLWDTGQELFTTEDQEHDLLDRDLRPFVEECDQMQGFQILAGGDDAWAGFAAKYLERLRDEFGRKAVWVWGTEDSSERGREVNLQKTVNLARTSSVMASQASLYMPLTNLPISIAQYLQLNHQNCWETSALQATVLESATLPTRLRSSSQHNRGLMADIEAAFTNEVNRNVLSATLDVGKPEPEQQTVNGINGNLLDHRIPNGVTSEDEHEELASQPEALPIILFRSSWGPSVRRRTARAHLFTQMLMLRGFPTPSTAPASQRLASSPAVERFSTSLLAPRPTSFPNIFQFPVYDQHAGLTAKTALTATTAVADRMRFFADVVGRSVSVEEREELKSDLLAKADEYIEGWDSGSEDSDDE